ncbi:hypothetical protein TRFO_18760 [Tritrichomonas foetus]|uniref:Myb-like DNA-binding domain containing protein n=1 Tax=Tritrichomonas foetus TaxID=1144522 RepID=A0A1J4KQI6_9EUKA|nr:hypothetical protein TRFO_18760 [Tritrichomonas foetus]|eukprot:OHT11701.1 hypothetical protein TRFO_18760 [Tritrichomonas foetus]
MNEAEGQPSSTPSETTQNKKKTRCVFSREEDVKLVEVISRVGDLNWNLIAKLMRSRTARQCKERWRMYLSPYVNHLPWTEYEDQLLFQKYHEIGPKWTKIAQYFRGRSDNSIKNHWNALNRKTAEAIPTFQNTPYSTNIQNISISSTCMNEASVYHLHDGNKFENIIEIHQNYIQINTNQSSPNSHENILNQFSYKAEGSSTNRISSNHSLGEIDNQLKDSSVVSDKCNNKMQNEIKRSNHVIINVNQNKISINLENKENADLSKSKINNKIDKKDFISSVCIKNLLNPT